MTSRQSPARNYYTFILLLLADARQLRVPAGLAVQLRIPINRQERKGQINKIKTARTGIEAMINKRQHISNLAYTLYATK